jgi:tripartite-type tricarboxylate transporter receptor subunit TctC
MARTFGGKLQERWGQPVVVENRPGAGGWIATRALQAATPDGYTLLAHSNGAYSITLFNKEADVRPGVNIQPLASVMVTPYGLLVNTAIPGKTARDFVAYAQANPGKLNVVVAPQSEPWIMVHDFLKQTGINAVVVPYVATAALQQALMANEGQFALLTPFGAKALVNSGKVAILAVTGSNRFPSIPDVPTVKEALGFELDYTVEFGFFAPQMTPKAIVDKLSNEVVDIASNTEIQATIRKLGYEPLPVKADAWTQSMRANEARVRAFVQSTNLKLD